MKSRDSSADAATLSELVIMTLRWLRFTAAESECTAASCRHLHVGPGGPDNFSSLRGAGGLNENMLSTKKSLQNHFWCLLIRKGSWLVTESSVILEPVGNAVCCRLARLMSTISELKSQHFSCRARLTCWLTLANVRIYVNQEQMAKVFSFITHAYSVYENPHIWV